jgi:lipopolysaccharide exporter
VSASSSSSIKKKAISSVGYKGLARFISYGLQALTTVILAQNLSAQDYGIVGFAMIFIGFLAGFNELGVGSAIVQRKELDSGVLNTAFTVRVALGLVAFGVAWVIAPLAAKSFGDPAVIPVMRILSLGFVIGIFGFIPSLLLLRELDFRQWVIATLAAAIVRSVLASVLALHGYGYWSLVIANLIGSVIESVGFMCFSKHRSRLHWDRATALELIKFGLPLFSSGLLVFALFNADNLIVGAVAGAAMLGYYALAFNWGSIFSKVIYEVFHSVLFPAFARIQDNPALLRRVYLTMMEQLGLFGLLIQGGLMVCAPDFLVVILGKGDPKWLPACHALQILCIYGVVRVLVEPLGNLLVALGQPKLIFRANFLATTVEIILIYPVLKLAGVEGVAILVTLSYTIQWVVYWPFLAKSLSLGWRDMWNVLAPSIIAATVAAITGILVSRWFTPSLASLAFKILGFTVMFLILQGVFSSWRWITDWKELLRERRAIA